MDRKVAFDMIKNIIIEQNTELLKQVSKVTGIDEDYLITKYLTPDYYLPIITKATQEIKTQSKCNKVGS